MFLGPQINNNRTNVVSVAAHSTPSPSPVTGSPEKVDVENSPLTSRTDSACQTHNDSSADTNQNMGKLLLRDINDGLFSSPDYLCLCISADYKHCNTLSKLFRTKFG